jgi:hypothetical protein
MLFEGRKKLCTSLGNKNRAKSFPLRGMIPDDLSTDDDDDGEDVNTQRFYKY